MKRTYYPYNQFLLDLQKLVIQMDSYKPDAIVAISRGGLTMGHLLGEYFSLRSLFTINATLYDGVTKLDKIEIYNIPDLSRFENILIVDEISDSGETLTAVKTLLELRFINAHFKTATLFQKRTSKFKPDWCVKETNDWIDFFWSVDLIADH